MENTKHTPGPWVIAPHTTVNKEFTVGPAIMDYDDVDHDQQDANARLIAASPMLLEVCDRTPNPSGSGTMSNYHIMLMAVVALRNEGHLTLANELEAIQQHQKAAIAKATTP